MRIKILHLTVALLSLLAGSRIATAQGTAFTYQGELTDGDSPANGTYVFGCTLFDSPANGTKMRWHGRRFSFAAREYANADRSDGKEAE